DRCQGSKRDQGPRPLSRQRCAPRTAAPAGSRSLQAGVPMTYLLILLALLACMALLDAKYKLFVFARPAPALLALVAGTGIFLLWDVIAIDAGIFLHRDSPLMTGVMLGAQLPLEEAFFLLFLCYQ